VDPQRIHKPDSAPYSGVDCPVAAALPLTKIRIAGASLISPRMSPTCEATIPRIRKSIGTSTISVAR